MNKRLCALLAVFAVAGTHGAFAQSPTYGPVQQSEDLWDIAHKIHPQADVTRDQVILALLKSNPLAVSVPCNANSVLRQGAVLTVPSIDEVRATGAAEAEREYARQIEAWKQYRESGRPIECPESNQPRRASTVDVRGETEVVAGATVAESTPETVGTTAAKPTLDTSPEQAQDSASSLDSRATAVSDSTGPSSDGRAQVAQYQGAASPSESSNRPEAIAENTIVSSPQASGPASPGQAENETDAAAAPPDTGHSRKIIRWAELWNDNSLLYVVTMTLIVAVIFVSGRLIRPK